MLNSAKVVFNCGGSIITSVENLKSMETLKNLIEDAGTETPIPVINVTRDTFAIVLTYVQQTRENPERVSSTHLLLEWESDFLANVVGDKWTDVIQAANYLDVPNLRTLIEKGQAYALRNCKTADEIRQKLRGSTPLLTREQEAQLVEDNPFLMEADTRLAAAEGGGGGGARKRFK